MMSINTIIIVATIIISLLAMKNSNLFYKLQYSPYLVNNRREWYRLISHGFVHSGYSHLFINMWVLWNFGDNVEYYFGEMFGAEATPYFIILYFGGIVFASIPAFKKHKYNINYIAVGASGAVSSILFSSILISPNSSIYLFFIPMPAFVFGAIYLFYEYYMDKKSKGNIAHDAHLWGAIYGLIITIIFNPELATSFFKKIFTF